MLESEAPALVSFKENLETSEMKRLEPSPSSC